MSAKTKTASKNGFRCVECGKGIVQPVAAPGRQARHRTLTLPVPADLEIPTCGNCGTEWIGDSVARKLDAALEKEFRVRMRDLVAASELVPALVAAGGDAGRLHSTTLEHSDPAALAATARDNAITSASYISDKRGWYVKLTLLLEQVILISFHPLERPLRTARGHEVKT